MGSTVRAVIDYANFLGKPTTSLRFWNPINARKLERRTEHTNAHLFGTGQCRRARTCAAEWARGPTPLLILSVIDPITESRSKCVQIDTLRPAHPLTSFAGTVSIPLAQNPDTPQQGPNRGPSAQLGEAFDGDLLEDSEVVGEDGVGDGPVDDDLVDAQSLVGAGVVDEGVE